MIPSYSTKPLNSLLVIPCFVVSSCSKSFLAICWRREDTDTNNKHYCFSQRINLQQKMMQRARLKTHWSPMPLILRRLTCSMKMKMRKKNKPMLILGVVGVGLSSHQCGGEGKFRWTYVDPPNEMALWAHSSEWWSRKLRIQHFISRLADLFGVIFGRFRFDSVRWSQHIGNF